MKKIVLSLAVVAALSAVPVQAQQWSLGAGAGPFVFDNFVERSFRVGSGEGTSSTIKTSLSAKTRPGVTVDLERQLNDTFSIRFRGTFVDSPLAVDGGASGGVAIESTKVDVTTLSVPFVFQLSRRGAIRFHVMGGPAYAMYKIRRQGNDDLQGVYSGSRNRFGVMAGAGIDWWLSDRFALEGEVADVITSSPFERSDYPAGTTGLRIRRPNNVHTSGGLRYRF